MNLSVRLPSLKSKRPWNSLKFDNKFNKTSSRSMNEEILKFKKIIQNCEYENKILKDTIKSFNNIKTSNDSFIFLYRSFETDINRLAQILEDRYKYIVNVENKFIFNSDKSEVRSSRNPTNRSQLLQDYTNLVKKLITLERKKACHNLKVKLFHDHRNLYQIKHDLNRIIHPEKSKSYDEEQILANKLCIKNLHGYIEHEKNRIKYLSEEKNEYTEAAIIIQSHWRRYLAEKKYKEFMKKNQKHIC